MTGDRRPGFRILLRLALLAALLGVVDIGRADETSSIATASLAGQFLVASPQMSDPRFAHTVIFIISHDPRGAMGVIVNHAWGSGSLRALFEGFGIAVGREGGGDPHGTSTDDPPTDDIPADDITVRLYEGGPVQQDHGFVLHSTDYAGESTRFVGKDVAISADPDVLRAIAAGQGPQRHLILLGYAGWGPGQLESELARDDWLTAPARPDEIFSDHPDTLWQEVLHTAGTPL